MINRTFRSPRFLAPMLALGIAACSGAPGDGSISAPIGGGLVRIPVTAAPGDPGNRTPNQGELEICKDGTAASFEVTPLGGAPFTVNLAAGECKVVVNEVLRSGLDTARFSVVEVVPATSTFTSVTKTSVHNEYDANAVGGVTPDAFDAPVVSLTNAAQSIKLNEYIGTLLVYVNAPVVQQRGCTYTKGWYRNNGSNTIIALADGLSKSQQQQVFNATPGKPGLVTWTGGNNTLNLYQQLLAAINNLGGETGGPAGVDAAIAAAKAGTTVTTNGGGVQIALVAGTNSSALIATLSSFNEGSLGGFPHCGDEVVAQ